MVYWYETKKNEILIRKRCEKGILANLMEVPSTSWEIEPYDVDSAKAINPLQINQWMLLPLEISHTFTHFHLKLKVLKTILEEKTPNNLDKAQWVAMKDLENHAFPTLMKKVIQAVIGYEQKLI